MRHLSKSTSRVVAITGASGGIGRAAAIEFARRGDRVALLARGVVGLSAAANQVSRCGVDWCVVEVDVADPAQVEAAVEQVEDRLGPIDVWVNVAFSSAFARFDDITAAEYRRATEVSYLGYVYATKVLATSVRVCSKASPRPRDSGSSWLLTWYTPRRCSASRSATARGVARHSCLRPSRS
jgi:NAD(P)-dependent dehydrogenase (short-subunit alcohol dehydrogenase family)